MLRLTWTLCSGCLSCSRWSRWWWGPLSRGSQHWPQPPVSRRQNWRSCREKRVSWHLEYPHVHEVRRTSSQTILEEFSWFSSYLSNICEWTILRENNISWYRLEGTNISHFFIVILLSGHSRLSGEESSTIRTRNRDRRETTIWKTADILTEENVLLNSRCPENWTFYNSTLRVDVRLCFFIFTGNQFLDLTPGIWPNGINIISQLPT